MAKKSDNEKRITKMLVIPDGESDFAGYENPGIVDASSAKDAIDAFTDQGVDLPIDFDHSTLDKGAAPNATGWIKSLAYEKGKGIMATVELSDEANDLIRTKKVKYVSPVAAFNKETHAITRLHSLALTNKPATKKMPEILEYAASRGVEVGDDEYLVAANYDFIGETEASKVSKKLHNAAYTLDSCVQLLKSSGVTIAPDQDPIDTIGEAIEMLVGLIEEARKMETEEMAAKEQAKEPVVVADDTIGKVLTEALGLKADAKPDEVVIAVEKLKARSAQTDEVKVLREKLDAIEKERAEEAKVAKDRRIEAKIDEACRTKNIRHNAALLSSIRNVYALSEAEGDAMVAAIDPVIPSGRVQTTQTSGTGNSRENVIVAASRAFDSAPDANMFDCRADYVNQVLRESKMGKLTADEALKFA